MSEARRRYEKHGCGAGFLVAVVVFWSLQRSILAAGAPDANAVVEMATKEFLFGLDAQGAEGRAEVLEVMEDGRVPALVYSLHPDKRERKPLELEIDKLEEKIAGLKAKMKEADEPRVFEIGRELEDAKYALDRKLMKAREKGLQIRFPRYTKLVLGLVVLEKKSGAWAIGRSLDLGSFDAGALGAKPEGLDYEVRKRDFNKNEIEELAVDVFIDLFGAGPEAGISRTHDYHYLVEFFPRKAELTFKLDGGVDSGGRCSGPLDSGTTARYFIRRRGNPSELVAIRSRTPCALPEGESIAEKEKPGVKRYAWSDKYESWQLYEPVEEDAYLIVAASEIDREDLEKPLKRLRRRKRRRRLGIRRGYPQIVEGDEVTGLKAGRFYVAVGLCEEKKQALKAVRFLRRRLRGRTWRVRMRGTERKGIPGLRAACPGKR